MKNITLKALVVCSVLLMGPLHAGIELKWGLSSRQGKRGTMEDRHVHILEFGREKDEAFFGVYDGHGGTEAAIYVKDKLHENFLRRTRGYDIEMRFKSSFRKTDADFLELKKKSGTAVVVAYFRQNKLNLAWSGDSRAVLEMAGAVGYETKDHKPFSDKDRIEKAGYAVIAWQDIALPHRYHLFCLLPNFLYHIQ